MNFVFDTNVLIHVIKGHPKIDTLEDEIGKSTDTSTLRIISIVTKAELESLAIQFKWGPKKLDELRILLSQYLVVPIDSQEIVDAYVDIDTFSQGKHPSMSLGLSSRNMGKNDIWIAATVLVTNSTLITGDGDFDHLNRFFPVIRL